MPTKLHESVTAVPCLEDCHTHTTLFWKKDPNSNPERQQGTESKDTGLSHTTTEHSFCLTVKSRMDVELTVKDGTQGRGSWTPRSHCPSRVPGGCGAPCWTTLRSGAHPGKRQATVPSGRQFTGHKEKEPAQLSHRTSLLRAPSLGSWKTSPLLTVHLGYTSTFGTFSEAA